MRLAVLFTIALLAIAGSAVAQEPETLLEGVYVADVETSAGFHSGSAEIRKTGETYHLMLNLERIADVVIVAIQTDQVLSGTFTNRDGDMVGLMVLKISNQGLVGVWAQVGSTEPLSMKLIRIGDPPPPFVGPPEPKKEEAPPAPPKRRVPANIGVA